MPKFTKHEREAKIDYAKRLFVKGFDFNSIAEMLQVAPATVTGWAADNDFDNAKRAAAISISELRNEILLTYEKMRNGDKPKMSPDQIAKLVSAFEKLSNNQNSLTWTYEAYELLTESLLNEIKAIASEKNKQQKFNTLKEVRKHMDSILDKIRKDLI